MRGSLLVVLAAVIGGGRQGEEPRLGEPFPLRVGETATVAIEDAALTLSFEAVERDSRCPRDVQCIRAGEAVVVLSVSVEGKTERRRFEVPPGAGAEEVLGAHGNIAPLRVRVEALEPEAESGKRIEREAYVATILVAEEDASRDGPVY